jgi:dehydrogenase E1 component
MRSLYAAMLKCRLLAPGHEATIAGVTADLRADDVLQGLPAPLVSALVKGSAAAPRGKNARTSMSHSAAFTAANKAAGIQKSGKTDAIALVVCIGRIDDSLWRRQLQSVRSSNLPMVLVRVPAKTVPATRKIPLKTPKALAFGVPHIAVDAADVLAVYRVAGEAIGRARQRRGPTFIECVNFAPGSAGKGKASGAADPLQSIETVLTRKRVLNAAQMRRIQARVAREPGETPAR